MKTKNVICAQKMICDYRCFLIKIEEDPISTSQANFLNYCRPDLHYNVVRIIGQVSDTSNIFGMLQLESDGSYTVQKIA